MSLGSSSQIESNLLSTWITIKAQPPTKNRLRLLLRSLSDLHHPTSPRLVSRGHQIETVRSSYQSLSLGSICLRPFDGAIFFDPGRSVRLLGLHSRHTSLYYPQHSNIGQPFASICTLFCGLLNRLGNIGIVIRCNRCRSRSLIRCIAFSSSTRERFCRQTLSCI